MEPHHYRHGTSLLDARCLTIFGTGHHQRRHAGSPKQALSLTIRPAPLVTLTGTERHYSRAGCGPSAARGLTISAGGGAGRPEAPAAKLTNGVLCRLRAPPTLGSTILVSGLQAYTRP